MKSITNFFNRFFENKAVVTIICVLGVFLGLSFILNPHGQSELTLILNGVFLIVYFGLYLIEVRTK